MKRNHGGLRVSGSRRTVAPSAALVCFGAVLSVLVIACEESSNPRATDACADEEVSFDTEVSAEATKSPLPEWAIGEFGYHSIDVVNLKIDASGRTVVAHDGGDFRVCHETQAHLVEGRVVLDDSLFKLITRDTTGELFLHREGTNECTWYRLEAYTLCGRDGGTLGGYGYAEPCSWAEGGCEPGEAQ